MQMQMQMQMQMPAALHTLGGNVEEGGRVGTLRLPTSLT